MEAKIARGRVLRELLKQDKLSPLPIEFQMAWLVAFNEGLFDGLDGEAVTAAWRQLAERCKAGGLTLDDHDEKWRRAVRDWLPSAEGKTA